MVQILNNIPRLDLVYVVPPFPVPCVNTGHPSSHLVQQFILPSFPSYTLTQGSLRGLKSIFSAVQLNTSVPLIPEYQHQGGVIYR